MSGKKKTGFKGLRSGVGWFLSRQSLLGIQVVAVIKWGVHLQIVAFSETCWCSNGFKLEIDFWCLEGRF